MRARYTLALLSPFILVLLILVAWAMSGVAGAVTITNGTGGVFGPYGGFVNMGTIESQGSYVHGSQDVLGSQLVHGDQSVEGSQTINGGTIDDGKISENIMIQDPYNFAVRYGYGKYGASLTGNNIRSNTSVIADTFLSAKTTLNVGTAARVNMFGVNVTQTTAGNSYIWGAQRMTGASWTGPAYGNSTATYASTVTGQALVSNTTITATTGIIQPSHTITGAYNITSSTAPIQLIDASGGNATAYLNPVTNQGGMPAAGTTIIFKVSKNPGSNYARIAANMAGSSKDYIEEARFYVNTGSAAGAWPSLTLRSDGTSMWLITSSVGSWTRQYTGA